MAERIASLCRENGVELLYAFGSRGKDASAVVEGRLESLSPSSSDLDVAALTEHRTRLGVREKVRLAAALEDLFQVPRVDLVLFREADPFLAAGAIRGERLFCADTLAADEYELFVLRRAGDLAPLERERLSLIQGS
jgi:uncharacterized protein